jgi:hypothetical protein
MLLGWLVEIETKFPGTVRTIVSPAASHKLIQPP